MGTVKANLIMEIMGRPPEHIKEALNTLVVKMGSEKGVSLLDKKYHKPKKIKEAKDLHITFAEIDVEFDSLEHFFHILMGYMPSNTELYEPEKLKLSANEINSLGNYLISKLHKYDEIAKKALVERDILLRQLQFLKEGGKMEDLMKTLKVENPDKNKPKSSAKKVKKRKKN